jgi:hypothetical protein
MSVTCHCHLYDLSAMHYVYRYTVNSRFSLQTSTTVLYFIFSAFLVFFLGDIYKVCAPCHPTLPLVDGGAASRLVPAVLPYGYYPPRVVRSPHTTVYHCTTYIQTVQC